MVRFALAACLLSLSGAARAAAPVSEAAATVAELRGQPQVLLDGVEPWAEARVGMELTPGSRVRTGRGRLTLLFFDGSKVRLEGNTQFTLESAERSRIAIFLDVGKLEAWVAKLRGRRFLTRTNAAVASVRGTILGASTNGRTTTFDLYQGGLEVSDAFGRSALLSAGQRIEAGLPGGPQAGAPMPPLAPLPLPPGWAMPREPKLAMLPPPPPGSPAPLPPPGETQTASGPPPPDSVPPPDASAPPPLPPPSPQADATISTVSPSAP